jgi:hypothetical protein
MLTPEVLGLFCKLVLQVDWPLNARELNELIFPERRFWVNGYYGKGAHGLVLSVQSLEDDQSYALKIYNTREFSSDDAALREFYIQRQFAAYHMAPRVHQMDIRRIRFRNRDFEFARVIMDPIYCNLQQALLVKQIDPNKILAALLCLMKKKYLLKYPQPFLHSDMHSHNLVLLQDKRTLGLIDFGLSVQKPAPLQLLDNIPLITSLQEAARHPRMTAAQSEILEKFAANIVKVNNAFFRVKMVPERFEIHPSGGGYQYRTTHQELLHSYDWPVSSDLQRTALPTEEDLRRAFPTLDPPTVVD